MKTNALSRQSGYTLVEALVAVSLLMFAVAAAAALTLAMANQEEMNSKGMRAIHWHESAVRLHQLGLSRTEALAILPPLPELIAYTVNAPDVTVGALGAVPVATSTLTYSTDPDGNLNDTNYHRPSVIKAFRVTK